MTKPTATPRPRGGADTTGAKRQQALRDRIAASNGKRVVIDLHAAGVDALQSLREGGYATTQSAIVNKALVEVQALQTLQSQKKPRP